MTWIATPQLRWVTVLREAEKVWWPVFNWGKQEVCQLQQKYINPNNGETKWVAVPLETQP